MDFINLIKSITEDYEVFDYDIADVETAYFSDFKIPDKYSIFINDLLGDKPFIVMQNINNGNFIIVFQTMHIKCIDKNDYLEFIQYLENEVNKL